MQIGKKMLSSLGPERILNRRLLPHVVHSGNFLEKSSFNVKTTNLVMNCRTLLMHGFHFLVWLFAVKKIRDTQCGFKLFTRASAKLLFTSLHVERW